MAGYPLERTRRRLLRISLGDLGGEVRGAGGLPANHDDTRCSDLKVNLFWDVDRGSAVSSKLGGSFVAEAPWT